MRFYGVSCKVNLIYYRGVDFVVYILKRNNRFIRLCKNKFHCMCCTCFDFICLCNCMLLRQAVGTFYVFFTVTLMTCSYNFIICNVLPCSEDVQVWRLIPDLLILYMCLYKNIFDILVSALCQLRSKTESGSNSEGKLWWKCTASIVTYVHAWASWSFRRFHSINNYKSHSRIETPTLEPLVHRPNQKAIAPLRCCISLYPEYYQNYCWTTDF